MNSLPEPPSFPEDVVERYRDTGDARAILFEWYKYVGLHACTAACLSLDSPGLRPVPPVHYAVLIGLLNRCSRLMVANLRLTSTGLYGEAARILDRCIAEAAIKVQWLCHRDNPDSFMRYLADGLRKDLILKRLVEENILARGEEVLVIERRMIRSIENCISLSGLSEQEVQDARQLPDFASMGRDLGLDELFYTAVQRMGSHAVHGTWSDLVLNYLHHEEDGGFTARDHEIEIEDIQYLIIARFVLTAVLRFLEYVVDDPAEVRVWVDVLREAESELQRIQEMAWVGDFRQC